MRPRLSPLVPKCEEKAHLPPLPSSAVAATRVLYKCPANACTSTIFAIVGDGRDTCFLQMPDECVKCIGIKRRLLHFRHPPFYHFFPSSHSPNAFCFIHLLSTSRLFLWSHASAGSDFDAYTSIYIAYLKCKAQVHVYFYSTHD